MSLNPCNSCFFSVIMAAIVSLPPVPRERTILPRPCTAGNIRNRGNQVFPILKNTPIGGKKREKFLCNRDQNVWLMLRVSA